MREIKFRIAEYEFNNELERGKFTGFLYLDASKGKFDSCWLNYKDNMVDICQFTGLKDKNGREIYEGDVLAFKEKSGILTPSFIVEWDNDNACFSVYNTNHKRICAALAWSEWQVIGNIYENPELLEVK